MLTIHYPLVARTSQAWPPITDQQPVTSTNLWTVSVQIWGLTIIVTMARIIQWYEITVTMMLMDWTIWTGGTIICLHRTVHIVWVTQW